jgi:hypothetical protein
MENPDNECLRSNTGYVGTTAAASTQTLPKWHGKDDRHNPTGQHSFIALKARLHAGLMDFLLDNGALDGRKVYHPWPPSCSVWTIRVHCPA